MINIKSGTQTWSNARQTADLKTDSTQNISSTDSAKYFQGEDVGETLNKVADPNYVNEAKKMRTVGKNELGKDAFMTLLLTQMKNQDPTNPLKSHEMAAQLAQFTSLEKLQGINDGVDGLRKEIAPDHNYQALSYIGKTVMVDNGKVSRTDTEGRHDIRFDIPNDAQILHAEVKDAAGNLIRSLEFKNLKAGKNEINWNGLTEEGAPAPVGDYTVTLDAVGSNGRKMFVETKTEGVISGVNFTPRGPQLLIGKQILNISDIKSVSDSVAGQGSQSMSNVQQPVQTEGPKKAEVKAETKADAEKRAKLSQVNINDAGMDMGLINELNKAGAKAGMSGT